MDTVHERRSDASLRMKYVIRGNIVLDSPLIIGAGPVAAEEELDQRILRTAEKKYPLIPGTALAGVLRSILNAQRVSATDWKNNKEDVAVRHIFGDIDGSDAAQSALEIADIVLQKRTGQLAKRDGVAIDPYTGAGIEGRKYDYEILDRDGKTTASGGQAELILTVRDGMDSDEAETAAKWLTDTLRGGISIGAMTAKGFGRVSFPDACYVVYDFGKPEAAGAWMDYLGRAYGWIDIADWKEDAKKKGLACYNAKKATSLPVGMLKITLHAKLRTSLLVRKGEMDVTDGDKKIQRHLKSLDDYVIPGTSVKGVLRSHGGYILRSLLPTDKAEELLQGLMGFAKSDQPSSKGAIKSRFVVDEVYISPNEVNAKEQNRTRIDRFTGGTIDRALFKEEPLWQKGEETPVHLSFSIEHCAKWEAGFALLLLRDIWLGDVAFGGDVSVGRGTLQGVRADIQYRQGEDEPVKWTVTNNGQDVDGDREALESFVTSDFKDMIRASGGEMS